MQNRSHRPARANDVSQVVVVTATRWNWTWTISALDHLLDLTAGWKSLTPVVEYAEVAAKEPDDIAALVNAARKANA